MPEAPTSIRRLLGWILDADPRSRGWTPPWTLSIVGILLALLVAAWAAAASGTFSPWQPNLSVLNFILDAGDRVQAGESYSHEIPDMSPVVVVLSLPLQLLRPEMAALFFVVVTVAATGVALWAMGVRGWVLWLATAAFASLAASAEILFRGDWLMVLLALVAVDVWMARRPRWQRWSGLATGAVVAVSPVWLLFLAPALVRRDWRKLLRSAIGFVVATLPAAIFAPFETFTFWRYHLLERFSHDPESLGHQPLVTLLTHHLGAESRMLTIGLAVIVWLAVIAVIAMALRRDDHATVVAAAAIGALFVAAWPASSVLVLPLVPMLFGRRPGRGSRVPAAVLALLGLSEVWRRLPEESYATTEAVTVLIGILVGWWLLLRLLELFEVRSLIPMGEVLTWPLYLLPFLTAFILAGTFFAPQSSLWPWDPLMPDFQVYVVAAGNYLDGNSLYQTEGWPFLYPPIAAVLALPTQWGEVGAEAFWIVMKLLLFLLVLYRIGLRDWRAPFVLSILVACFGVFSADIMMGNFQGLMVAMIFLDLAPGRTLFQSLAERFDWKWARGRTHLLPPGILTGFVTAIKIIPGLFLVLAALRGRWKLVRNAVITGGVMTLAGAALAPRATLEFAGMLLGGQINHAIEGDGLHYLSLVTGIQRFLGHGDTVTTLATLLSMVIGVIGFFAAWRWHRAGREWIGLSLCGIATIYFSPVAWNYYYVFLLPAALIVVRQIALKTPMPRWIQFVVLVAFGWATFEYHLRLPNDGEIESFYTVAQKITAMMMPVTSALALIAAAILGRRRPAEVRARDRDRDLAAARARHIAAGDVDAAGRGPDDAIDEVGTDEVGTNEGGAGQKS